jgi:dihydrofolate reductase
MGEVTADLFISLDGFASGLDQPPYFGYFGPGLASWVRDHLVPPQLIVIGRTTYEAHAQFVPSVTDEASARMNALPKLVFSNSLADPLAWKNTRLVKRPVADEIKALKQQRGATPINRHGAAGAGGPP